MTDVQELVDVLDGERLLLENLIFRLTGTSGLLGAGDARFLGWAAIDIAAAASAVREVELRRIAVLGRVGDGSPLTIALIEGSVGEPWCTLLSEHREVLCRLTDEACTLLRTTHALARAGLRRIEDGRFGASGGAGSPGPRPSAEHLDLRLAQPSLEWEARGRRPEPDPPFDDLDHEIVRSGYEAVVAATVGVAFTALLAFLA